MFVIASAELTASAFYTLADSAIAETSDLTDKIIEKELSDLIIDRLNFPTAETLELTSKQEIKPLINPFAPHL